MSRKKDLGKLKAVALFVTAAVVLTVAPCAWAQSAYKSLYRFTGGADGGVPFADLILTRLGTFMAPREVAARTTTARSSR